jgi:hypothetical protein
MLPAVVWKKARNGVAVAEDTSNWSDIRPEAIIATVDMIAASHRVPPPTSLAPAAGSELRRRVAGEVRGHVEPNCLPVSHVRCTLTGGLGGPDSCGSGVPELRRHTLQRTPRRVIPPR